MQSLNKATIVPLEWVHHDLLERMSPLELGPDLGVQSVKDTLTSEHFKLWGEFLSERERKDLPKIKLAIVHRFFSQGHVGREEAESKLLCYRAFVALRLVKPTRSRFTTIQYKVTEEGEIDVFGFSHTPSFPVNTPDSEAINRIDAKDLVELRRLFPAFEAVSANGPENLQRAIRYFDMSYASIPYPEIQFLTWVMGIEAAAADQDRPPLGRSQLVDNVLRIVGPATPIYGESSMGEFLDLPTFTIGDVLGDVFKLRSRLTHGGWIPDWRPEVKRATLAKGTLSYSEMLLEAAPFILRKLILARIEQSLARS
jgi:hypothetical protein